MIQDIKIIIGSLWAKVPWAQSHTGLKSNGPKISCSQSSVVPICVFPKISRSHGSKFLWSHISKVPWSHCSIVAWFKSPIFPTSQDHKVPLFSKFNCSKVPWSQILIVTNSNCPKFPSSKSHMILESHVYKVPWSQNPIAPCSQSPMAHGHKVPWPHGHKVPLLQ